MDNKKNINKRYIVILMLATIIILQTMNLIYCFLYEKEGYHSDEVYTYGTANSIEGSFLSSKGRQDYTSRYNSEWISGKLFNDYLCANQETRFRYDYIIHNESDIHVPLYFVILHTICSFFPDTFSWWYGFSINLISFIVCLVFLFLLVREITQDSFMALLVCFFYGFSQAAVNTHIYIRMYALETCLGVISGYAHAKLYNNSDKFKKILPFIFISTFLGGMSHLYFWIFEGILSACFWLYFLLKKKYKQMFSYAATQILTVIIFLCIHPYILAEFFDVRGRKMGSTITYGGFWFEFRTLVSDMFRELLGIKVSTAPTYFFIHLAEIVILVLVIMIPTVFLFRKEIRKCNLISKIKSTVEKIIIYFKKKNIFLYISVALAVAGYFSAVAATALVFGMGIFATRYIFILYPYIVICLAEIIQILIDFTSKAISIIGKMVFSKKQWKITKDSLEIVKKAILSIVTVIMLVNIHFNGVKDYYFKEAPVTNVKIEELTREANYIISLNEYWVLDCMSYSLRNVENFYAFEQKQFLGQKEQLEQLKSDKPVYLLLSSPEWKEMVEADGEEIVEFDEKLFEMMSLSNDIESENVQKVIKKYEEFCLQLSICDKFEYIGTGEVYGRYFFVFCLR